MSNPKLNPSETWIESYLSIKSMMNFIVQAWKIKKKKTQNPHLKNLLYVGLQPWLFFIVFYEERQTFGPVVLKASR